ncbi:MAG TPA: DnaD domain protein [Rubrobacteraceae bacterium]|nr:DnaD domain protein [Rubrobacteraceae bacterium]
MERVRLTPPGENRQRGERARLYVRWMPHLGAEAVALYELLRVLPEVGLENIEVEELAELLRSTPESVEESFEKLSKAGFVVERNGWLEVAGHPPANRASDRVSAKAEKEEKVEHTPEQGVPRQPGREIEVVRAEPEGVSADDYFNFMGTLPAPHIVEFLNVYCERDGMSPDVVREALKIASERDARRVGYVRSILERWVERGVKSVEDVERFEKDRKLRLVEQSGAVKGGAMKMGEGVRGGADRQSAARRREGYEWLFGE